MKRCSLGSSEPSSVQGPRSLSGSIGRPRAGLPAAARNCRAKQIGCHVIYGCHLCGHLWTGITSTRARPSLDDPIFEVIYAENRPERHSELRLCAARTITCVFDVIYGEHVIYGAGSVSVLHKSGHAPDRRSRVALAGRGPIVGASLVPALGRDAKGNAVSANAKPRLPPQLSAASRLDEPLEFSGKVEVRH